MSDGVINESLTIYSGTNNIMLIRCADSVAICDFVCSKVIGSIQLFIPFLVFFVI